jgi:hypothetical protein
VECDVHDELVMNTEAPVISARPTKPIKPAFVRCRQCGERIAVEHLPKRDLSAPVLCVDCAFDDMPHTD